MRDMFLLSRLQNCLSTILDLEKALQNSATGNILNEEFATLKRALSTIDSIILAEEDVERIEKATTLFLEELKEPLRGMDLFDQGQPRHIH